MSAAGAGHIGLDIGDTLHSADTFSEEIGYMLDFTLYCPRGEILSHKHRMLRTQHAYRQTKVQA